MYVSFWQDWDLFLSPPARDSDHQILHPVLPEEGRAVGVVCVCVYVHGVMSCSSEFNIYLRSDCADIQIYISCVPLQNGVFFLLRHSRQLPLLQHPLDSYTPHTMCLLTL